MEKFLTKLRHSIPPNAGCARYIITKNGNKLDFRILVDFVNGHNEKMPMKSQMKMSFFSNVLKV